MTDGIVRCNGRKALGPCDKAAKWRVEREHRTGDVHLAQIIGYADRIRAGVTITLTRLP